MKNTTSKFPSMIDDRVFFEDINLTQLDIKNQYEQLLQQGKYTEASQLLNNSDVDFYGAWILNLLENRLLNIQTYLQDETKPHLVDYNTQPTTNGAHWISD